MRRIYAYYSRKDDGVIQEETLGEHIREALRAVNNMKKVLSYGLRLSKDFQLMLSLSVILHDLGKVVYNQYLFKPDKGLSFRGHEIVSTWLIHKFIDKFDEDTLKIPREEWDIIGFSVINHHHPMKVSERCEDLTKEPLCSLEVNEDTVKLFLYEVESSNVVDKELREIISSFGNEDFLRSISGVKLGIIASDTCGQWGIYTSLWRRVWFDANPNVRQLFLLNEQGLVVADYYAASVNRGEAMSEFGKAIQDFVRLYSLDYHLALKGI